MAIQAQRRTVIYLPKYNMEKYHFGFQIGFNQMMYSLKYIPNFQNEAQDPNSWPNAPINIDKVDELYVYDLTTQKVPGFTVGIIGNLRLGNYFDLRFIPSLSFGERKLDYTFVTKDIDPSPGDEQFATYNITKSIFSTFVEFPWLIKYRSKRYNNIGGYIIGGINPKLDLATQKKDRIEINMENTQTTVIDNIQTKRFDIAAEIGAGYDFYNQWFKMGVEIKMSYGLLNIVKEDDLIYTADIKKLRNKMFLISLTFE